MRNGKDGFGDDDDPENDHDEIEQENARNMRGDEAAGYNCSDERDTSARNGTHTASENVASTLRANSGGTARRNAGGTLAHRDGGNSVRAGVDRDENSYMGGGSDTESAEDDERSDVFVDCASTSACNADSSSG